MWIYFSYDCTRTKGMYDRKVSAKNKSFDVNKH